MHIGIDCKTGRRQQPAFGDYIVSIETDAAGQPQPALDAAFLRRGARAGCITVVVDQTAAPIASQFGIVAARKQVGVLDRDHRLIVVAIERPGLDLPLGAEPAVQEMMERMQAVVTPCADIPQFCFELVFTQQPAHNMTSIPSSAISQSSRMTRACSGEPSTRIGLVLLIWMKMRLALRSRSASSVPSVPPIDMWPIRRLVFDPVPLTIISSSRKRVPSKNTTSARSRRLRIRGVIAAAPGM